MKQATQRTTNTPFQLSLHYRIREAKLLLSVGAALFLFMALVSYHESDPSWSHTGISRHVVNAAGLAGAWIADFLLYLFGYMAHLFPILFTYQAIRLYQARKHEKFDTYLVCIRGSGLVLTIVGGCGVLSLHFSPLQNHLPYHSGGILGDLTGPGMLAKFNFLGTTMILFVAVLSGFTLATGFSWLKAMDKIGSITLTLAERGQSYGRYLLLRIQYYWQQYREKHSQQQPPQTQPAVMPKPINNVSEQAATSQVINTFRRRPSTSSATKAKATQPNRRKKTEILTTKHATPPLQLLDEPERIKGKGFSKTKLAQMANDVEAILKDFSVDSRVVAVYPGPVITRFELQLAPGVKVSRISGLAKDLARSMSVISVRIVEIIPGKSVIGLEVPNDEREVVRLSEVLDSKIYQSADSPLSMALGKDISGEAVVVNLQKMPHLLVAGTTGSGKSVGLNAMLLSLLYKASPKQARFIMIDPKMLELSIYDGIPHLLTPVVTDMKEAANALRWCVAEMERRYQVMAKLGVRSLSSYNSKVSKAIQVGRPILDPFKQTTSDDEQEQVFLQTLPYVVVVIDEFADMIMIVGKKVEELIARIAQKARAAGIHLILATQRPSVDVITGLIKANVPTRIAYQVSSKIDSRTIIDQQGAEQLLGHGDMLYLPPGSGVPIRVHGAFVADHEVHAVVSHIKAAGEPDYLFDIIDDSQTELDAQIGNQNPSGEADPLYDQAVQIVLDTQKASISGVQRRLKIGYNRAARLLEAMEQAGVVSTMSNNGCRDILITDNS